MKKVMAITVLAGAILAIATAASAWEVVVRRGNHYYHHRPHRSYVSSYGYPGRVYYSSSPYTVRRVYYPGYYSSTTVVDEVVDTYYIY